MKDRNFKLFAKRAVELEPRSLVVVKAKVSDENGDGQHVNIEVRDEEGNSYGHPRDVVVGDTKLAFTSHADTMIEVCIENTLDPGSLYGLYRTIEFDLEMGSEAIDYEAIRRKEKLKPLEVELCKIENILTEINQEMEYFILQFSYITFSGDILIIFKYLNSSLISLDLADTYKLSIRYILESSLIQVLFLVIYIMVSYISFLDFFYWIQMQLPCLENVEINAKEIAVKYLGVTEGDRNKWQVKPISRSIAFAICRFPSTSSLSNPNASCWIKYQRSLLTE